MTAPRPFQSLTVEAAKFVPDLWGKATCLACQVNDAVKFQIFVDQTKAGHRCPILTL